MGGGISVGVPRKAGFAGPLKPGKKQRPPGLERMHIDPEPHARHILHAQHPTGPE
jgi:hypothetical protein